MAEPEPSCTAGGNVKWCSWCGKSRVILQTVQRRMTIRSSNSAPRSTPPKIWKRRLEQSLSKTFNAHVCSNVIHSSQKVKVTQTWVDAQTNMNFTQGNVAWLYKGMKFWPCRNRCESWRQYAKSQINQSRDNKYCRIAFTWSPRVVTFAETEW